MIAWLSCSDVSGPKFMVPSTNRDTDSPLRPSWAYSMSSSVSIHDPISILIGQYQNC
jgi:hypothetical protein